jgi:hypothetical protein
MKIYTPSEARRQFTQLLEEAQRRGAVRVRRQDGQEFLIHPVEAERSPLDVEGISLDLTAEEIVAAVREVRER